MKTTRTTLRAGLAVLGISLLAACGGGGGTGPIDGGDQPDTPEPPTPQPGTLTGRLTTPNTDDAAIQFTATATGSVTINSVAAACSGCTMFSKTVSGSDVRGVIVGSFASGQPLLTLSVSDVANPAVFSVSVVSVATGDLQVRQATGYTVAVGS